MNINFICKKLRFLRPAILLFISSTIFFGSCIISKNNKTASKVPETKYIDKNLKTGKNAEKNSESQPDYNLKPPFTLLNVTYNSFLKFFDLTNFHQFKVIPYQRNPGDMVRLYCYALSSEYDGSKIGEAFYISADGSGEIPRTLYHPIIYNDLVLSKADMKQIFTAEPVSVIYLTLVPVKAIENGKNYNSYRVYKNGHDTKIQCSLSPKNFN